MPYEDILNILEEADKIERSKRTELRKLSIETRKVMRHKAISLQGPWDKDTYIAIRSYLASGASEKNLDCIEDALRCLHSALRENFSIQDVLLEVGEYR